MSRNGRCDREEGAADGAHGDARRGLHRRIQVIGKRGMPGKWNIELSPLDGASQGILVGPAKEGDDAYSSGNLFWKAGRSH